MLLYSYWICHMDFFPLWLKMALFLLIILVWEILSNELKSNKVTRWMNQKSLIGVSKSENTCI